MMMSKAEYEMRLWRLCYEEHLQRNKAVYNPSVTVRIPSSLQNLMKEYCVRKGRTITDLIMKAVISELSNELVEEERP